MVLGLVGYNIVPDLVGIYIARLPAVRFSEKDPHPKAGRPLLLQGILTSERGRPFCKTRRHVFQMGCQGDALKCGQEIRNTVKTHVFLGPCTKLFRPHVPCSSTFFSGFPWNKTHHRCYDQDLRLARSPKQSVTFDVVLWCLVPSRGRGCDGRGPRLPPWIAPFCDMLVHGNTCEGWHEINPWTPPSRSQALLFFLL